jgi:hypothetical protein
VRRAMPRLARALQPIEAGPRAVGATRWLCATIATIVLGAPAAAQETPPPIHTAQEIAAEEDRIDRSPPAEQVVEHARLRRLLLERDDAPARAALGRVSAKLELSRLRVENADAGYAVRLSLCRKAAAIGEAYILGGDPQRALFWERVCASIEPHNEYASVLRNRINAHFADLLDGMLVADDWVAARSLLTSWRGFVEGDPAVERGHAAYADARSRRFMTELPLRDVAAVLRDLEAERALVGHQRSWNDVRRAAAAHLQGPFDVAVAQRRIDDAASALRRQRAAVEEFGAEAIELSIDRNQTQLDELVAALAPSPIERPFGYVHGAGFRLEAGGIFGEFDSVSRGVRIVQQTWAPSAAMTYRSRREGRTCWYGVDVEFAGISTREGVSASTISLACADVLAGRSGERWAAWVSVGGTYSSLRFVGTVAADEARGYALGTVGAGGERALGGSLTAFADARYVSLDAFRHLDGRAGLRYYANPNFGLDVHVRGGLVRTSDEASGAQIEAEHRAVGLSTVIQF